MIITTKACNITLPSNGLLTIADVRPKICLQRVNVTLVCVGTRFDKRTMWV